MTLGIITNAPKSGQPSMIGYGQLLLREMTKGGFVCREFAGVSFASRGQRDWKLSRNIDRFLLTPLALAARQASVLHSIDPGNALYHSIMRAPVTSVTVHDMIPYLAHEGKLEGFRPSLAGRALMRQLLRTFQRADALVTVSETTRCDLARIADIPAERITVIPNAVFLPLRSASFDEQVNFRSRYGLPTDAPILLNIGRNFYKNRVGVAEIFARVARCRSDAHLVFVSLPDAVLVTHLDRLGITDRVHFLAHVSSEDMAALYSTASVLVFPSLYEGFGYPVIEAQLCGTPVVCSNAGALGEIAGQSAAVFDVTETGEMADAVLRILDEPGFAGYLCRLGHANAERFSVERWSDAYASYFLALAERKGLKIRRMGTSGVVLDHRTGF